MKYLSEPRTVAVVGAPLALGQDLAGVEDAPTALRDVGLAQAILELGWQVNDTGDLPFDLPHHRESDIGQVTLGKVKYAHEVGTACRLLSERVATVAGEGKFCLTLGGDHSIAMGSISGMVKTRPDVSVVWVDAHGDFNTPESSPSGHLHGMPLAALMGKINPGSMPGFDWLTQLLKSDHVTLIGVRSIDAEERVLLRESGIKVFTMMEVDRYGIGRVMEMALNAINPDGNRPIHLSLDIDALDPYIAPNTGTKARGGLNYREAHYICEALAETGALISMDLVEINPRLGYLEDRHNLAQGGTNLQEDATVEMGVELVASALGKRIL
jgi:arginase